MGSIWVSLNLCVNIIVLLPLLLNYVSGFSLELIYLIPHCKYQIKPHSSLWFSAVFAAVAAHRNHSFHIYTTGWRFSLSYCSLSATDALSSASARNSFFAEIFIKCSSLGEAGFCLPAFCSRTNLKLIFC